jgi:hypothetical protein
MFNNISKTDCLATQQHALKLLKTIFSRIFNDMEVYYEAGQGGTHV